MGSFSGLGIGLSFVFGCILMGLVAELYYLLWWKKRIAFSTTRAAAMESFLLCWKRPPASFNSASSNMELTNSSVAAPQEVHQDLEMGAAKDLGVNKGYTEEGIETELMRVHNLSGPPRFLFTIKEENREDLESEEQSRKGSRTSRSLSDLVFGVDGNTPFLTPLSSPTTRTHTFLDCASYCHSHGFNNSHNPLFEGEINSLRSSPPPKFKFLREAEEKLIRRLLLEEAERSSKRDQESAIREEKDVPSLAKVLPLRDQN